ncbi:HupE/UreJ family protein [Seohaeicola saemankumensis]|nr:HupE/UreJ family protein [Seohaeicola saemankumensis]MCA0871325.1 HupE/UreJ family protein [Seohaeicola saemankumensis]
MMFRLLMIAMLCLCGAMPQQAGAHALDPGYLELRPLGGDSWRVFWRKPDVKGQPMRIEARLPEGCDPAVAPAEPQFDGAAWVTAWVAQCAGGPSGGLSGGRIVIEGLEATQTEVLVRMTDAEGGTTTARLTPDAPYYEVPEDLSGGQVFAAYLVLGFDHILEGLDHLLFVFALLVLIRSPGRLVGAITAFTVAHSITLALASLGLLQVPGPPVEAAIALSIVLLAVEILRQREGGDQLAQRYPWVISFSFGLLHGLGFAGALAEIGLPEGDIPMALLAFNLGVEAGQLVFVAAVLAVFWALRLVWPRLVALVRDPAAPGTVVMGYGIGIVSTWWLAERVAGF